MENLPSALATYYQPERVYSWAEKLDEFNALSSFTVDQLGELHIPLSLVDVRNIQTLFESQVPAATIGIPNFEKFAEELSTIAMAETMQVDIRAMNVNIKTDLIGMIVCDDNEHEQSSNFRKGDGLVGNLILQVPVDATDGGALLMVDTGRKSRYYDFSHGSESSFYLAGVFGAKNMLNGASFSIKRACEIPVVSMIFNLTWINCTLNPARFPGFLKAAHAVSQCFADVISKNVNNNDCVCLSLKSNYQASNFRVQSLETMDRSAFEIVKTVKQLDVELTVLKKEKEKVSVPGAKDEIIEVVGDLNTIVAGSNELEATHHPVLLIRLRTSLAENTNNKLVLAKVIAQLKIKLSDVLSTGCGDLVEIKGTLNELDEDFEFDENSLPTTLRMLLNACQKLSAADEGVMIFKFMAKSLPFTYAEFVFSERDIQRGLNEIIVEFICTVSGWTACSRIFIDVIEKTLTFEVCSVFIDLASKLFAASNEAAEEIVDKIIENLCNISREKFQKENLSVQLPKLTNLILNMKLFNSSKHEQLAKSFDKILSKMTFSQLCYLTEESHEFSKYENVLCKAIAESTFDCFDPIKIHHLTNSFNCQPHLMKSLWTKLCHQIIEEHNNSKWSLLEEFFVTELTSPGRRNILVAIAEDEVFYETLRALIASFVKKSKREENTEKILCYYSLVVFAHEMQTDETLIEKFVNVFPQLPSEKLCGLNVKLFDDEGDKMKQSSSRIEIFTCLSNEILNRDLWTVMKSFCDFPEVAANIVWLGNCEMNQLLLDKTSQAAKIAFHQSKPLEIAAFLSKYVENIVKRELSIEIIPFLCIWFNAIIKIIQEKKFDETSADSFLLMLMKFEEKHLIIDHQMFEKFSLLALKLPLNALKQIIITVSQEQKGQQTFKIYKDLCMKFIYHPNLEKSSLPQNELSLLFQLFLELKEEEPISRICRLIRQHPLPDIAGFLTDIQSKQMIGLARASSQGTEAFKLIIENCIERLGETLKNGKTWAFPENPRSLNEEVNGYLMSDKQVDSFGSYAYRSGAINFGKRTITNAEWGIEFKAVLINSKFACEFTKTKQFAQSKEYLSNIESTINQLTVLKAKLLNKHSRTATEKTPLGDRNENNINKAVKDPVKETLFASSEESPAKRRRLV